MSNDQKKTETNQAWWMPPVAMFARLSAWIAFPVLLGIYVGKKLDQKYNSDPWLFLASVGAAFIVSMVGLVINTNKEFKKIMNVEQRNKEDKK